MSDTRKIIDFAAEDNAVAFRDALYSAIHDKVTAHIEAKKQEVAQNLITRNESVEYEELDEAAKLQPDQKVKGYTLKHVKTSNPRSTDDMDQPIRATVRHYEVHKGDQKVGEIKHYHDSYYGHDFSGTMHGKKIKSSRFEGDKKTAANFLSALTKNEEVELDEGKIDDLADKRAAEKEKKAANYEFGNKSKKTLKTIRKVAGHSDSGKKHKDDEKEED